MKLFLTYILLIFYLAAFSQNKKQDKPKFDPNKKYQTISMDLMSKEDRIKFMKNNFASYCLKDTTYCNAYERLNYQATLTTIEKYYSCDGIILTIKMSANGLFVFMFNNICDFYEKTNGQVYVTFFNYKFGEVDETSIKSVLIQKKRQYPNNNIFTEELAIGGLRFIIENKTNFKQMIFANKVVTLAPYDFNQGFSDRIGK